LVFSVSTRDSDGKTHLYILQLKGKWQADKYNRLSFLAKKQKNLYDTLTLSGSWKINEKLGLLFEMPYEKGRLRSIAFEAACSLGSGYNLNLRLKNLRYEDLGINLKLSKTFFKNQDEAFLEALKEGKEVSLLAGAGFRW